MDERTARNKLGLPAYFADQENSLFRAHFVKGLAAFGVGFVIVLLFALHPSVNAYHTGFAGLFVSAIFLTAVVAGATVRRIYVLVALLFLVFVEPEVTITNSLVFNIVSNGLLIGAGTAWLLSKPYIAKSSLPILAAIAGVGLMAVLLPAVVGMLSWIHIHDALMFGKFGLVIILAMSIRPETKTWSMVAASIAAGSFLVAMFIIVQSFHIPAINNWMFSTYLSARNFTEAELPELANNYARAYGVAGPVDSAALLVMSFGAWFVLLIKSDSLRRSILAATGTSLILIAIYLTGSRLGIAIAVPVLLMGIVWFKAARSDRPLLRTFAVTLAFALLAVIGITLTNSSFGETVRTTNARVTSTIPNLLRGQPDPSFRDRIDEYAQLDLGSFRVTGVRNTEWTSEYIVLIYRFGLAGFLLVWQFWIMILIRSVRASSQAIMKSDRMLGVVAVIAVLSTVVAAIGTHSILDPSRMTLVLIAVGLTPALGALAPIPSTFRLRPVAATV